MSHCGARPPFLGPAFLSPLQDWPHGSSCPEASLAPCLSSGSFLRPSGFDPPSPNTASHGSQPSRYSGVYPSLECPFHPSCYRSIISSFCGPPSAWLLGLHPDFFSGFGSVLGLKERVREKQMEPPGSGAHLSLLESIPEML